MKRIFFSILTIFLAAQVMGQIASNSRNYIEFSNGVVLEGQDLTYKKPILKDPYFVLDNETYTTDEVSYFRNNHGFFAKIPATNFSPEKYALRIKKGEIDMFETIDMRIYGEKQLEVPEQSNPNNSVLATGETFQFYRKGTEELKKARYATLKYDLADNPASMEHLKTYRKYQWLQRGLIALGAGLFAGTMAMQHDQAVQFTPAMGLGIALGGSSFFCKSPKEDYLWWAVESYNE